MTKCSQTGSLSIYHIKRDLKNSSLADQHSFFQAFGLLDGNTLDLFYQFKDIIKSFSLCIRQRHMECVSGCGVHFISHDRFIFPDTI